MTTTAPNASQSRLLSARPRAASARRGPKRSAGLVTLAALLVVGFGLATGIVVSRAGDKVPVVTVAADVPKGHLIERGDLTSQAVSGIAGAIAAEHLEQVVGSTAAVDLVAGQVLVDGMVTDAVLPAAGDSLVGFALDASRVPAVGLATGDLVRVVAVPAGQASGDVDTVNLDTPPVLTQDAVVHSIRGASDGGAIELTLVVAEKDANRVAAYGTAGRVVLVEIAIAGGE